MPRPRLASAITNRAVEPAIAAPSHIVDHRMSIPRAKTGIEFLDFVGDTVAVRITQPQDVRRLLHNDTVLVEHERGHSLEALVKNMFLVHTAIAIAVCEPGNPVFGRTQLRFPVGGDRNA